jgi:hypothetical protein
MVLLNLILFAREKTIKIHKNELSTDHIAKQKEEKNDQGDGEKNRRLIPKSKTEEQKEKN